MNYSPATVGVTVCTCLPSCSLPIRSPPCNKSGFSQTCHSPVENLSVAFLRTISKRLYIADKILHYLVLLTQSTLISTIQHIISTSFCSTNMLFVSSGLQRSRSKRAVYVVDAQQVYWEKRYAGYD